jgi:hypothetical protein
MDRSEQEGGTLVATLLYRMHITCIKLEEKN